MAELDSEFIAETLNSRQLLALLFVCESQRKKVLSTLNFCGTDKPPAWTEFLDRFAARLIKLPESERVYLINSHLQSSEEIDIYSNAEIEALLGQHHTLLATLARELEHDRRFF
ncbi:MAG: hypothetical protein EPO61_00865 [Nitrospirae bacterium]|nr:MAG: hypothetical protein EPO61_00865 [Nitrospirota bacterium]